MARSASSSDRSIPHLRDIFWSGAPPQQQQQQQRRQAHGVHGQGLGQGRHDDVNELAYQFQSDARVSGRGGKGNGSSHHSNYHHTSHHKQQQNDLGNDSAISVGSTSEDEHQAAPTSKKKSKKSRARDNARTLTERDVKHLERHLSMKKTIRKKIMRDLQQAFVEDPTEFRVEDINSHEQLIQSLSFGTPSRHAARHTSRESNFLDMLRATDPTACQPRPLPPAACTAAVPAARHGGACDDQDSGHGSPRGSPTRDLSADRGLTASSQQQQQQQQQHLDDYDDGGPAEDPAGKKTSFWRRFTMKGKSKR